MPSFLTDESDPSPPGVVSLVSNGGIFGLGTGGQEFCVPLHVVPQEVWERLSQQTGLLTEWKETFDFDGFAAEWNGGSCAEAFSDRFFNLPVDSRFLDSECKKLLEDFLRESKHEFTGALVNSDNIEFLRRDNGSLRKHIQLIYMDPPYNTGNTHYSYNDRFNRHDWLSMLRECLSLLFPLLRDDGTICVSIDDSEVHHLRILLDEVFGEKNFAACVAYERSGSAGLGQGSVILNNKEYILIYCLDKRSLNDIGHERPIDKEVMKRYRRILVDQGKRELVEEIPTQNGPARLYQHKGFLIKSISLKDFETRIDEIEEQYSDSFSNIFRTQNVQKENTFQNDVIGKLDKSILYSLEYVPVRGRYKGQEKTLYYFNGELCAWLKDSSYLTEKGIIKRNKLTDFWSHADIPKADLANEGGVLFSRSKKPEHLLYRLISLATKRGDLVLDPFLGSGTTAAVAQKLGRRWIGIESGDFFADCPLKRMKRVTAGDTTGISRLTDWRGGNSFLYSLK